jgi:hypothetical protein
VVLTSEPTADVVIPVASSDTTEGTVSAASLTFTAADWNVPQTVTVTGVDDLVDDGDIAYSVVAGCAASSDPIYAAIDPADVAVTNADNDAAGITVTPVAGSAPPRRAAPRASPWSSPASPPRRGHPGRLQRYDGGHGLGREPDVHRRRLERAADRHRDRRR